MLSIFYNILFYDQGPIKRKGKLIYPVLVFEGCWFHPSSVFLTFVVSQQARHSFQEDVLVLRVHGLVCVQLQREGGVARCECSQNGGIAL